MIEEYETKPDERIIPAYIGLLGKWQHEMRKNEQPRVDEQQWNLWVELICTAMGVAQPVTFIMCENGREKRIAGLVHYIDERGENFRLFDEHEGVQRIYWKDVIAVEIFS